MSLNNAVARQTANQLGTGFQVRFGERLYQGPARWYDESWRTHARGVDGDPHNLLVREPGVTRAIEKACEPPDHLDPHRIYLRTCVNPECPRRMWILHSQEEQDVLDPAAYQRVHWEDLRALARGRLSDLRYHCDNCRQKCVNFPIAPVRRRWIYVLREEGDNLVPAFEVQVGDEPTTGRVFTQVSGGRFVNRGARAFEGFLVLPHPQRHTWHFFLSPVRLGAQGLDLLRRLNRLQADYDRARSAGRGADFHVNPIDGLQPWATTVKRRFGAEQVRDGAEFVALVDPFAWAAQIADLDLMPMLFAQHRLLGDADEQSKAFVCSVLAQAMGRERVGDGNPPEYEVDRWDVRDDTRDPPSAFAGSGNAARAWVDRYQRAAEFLSAEVDRAVGRLMFVLRYSLGHRVAELGCQELHGEPESEVSPLSLGVAHWAHVLHEIQCGRPGRAYVEYLVGHNDNRDRIPQKNVLRGENARTVIASDRSRGLFAQVLAQCCPSVVANHGDAAQRIATALQGIEVQATTLGAKDLQGATNLSLDVAGAAVDHYLGKIPAEAGVEEMGRACRLRAWRERLTTVRDAMEFFAVFSLLSAFNEYGKEGRRDETRWDAFGRGRAYAETPLKAAEFAMKQGQRLMRASFTPAEQALVQRLESGVAVAALEAGEYELLLASRSVRAFRAMGTGLRVIAGPVGLITGGMDLVSESAQTRSTWLNGDPGAAAAHGIQAVGAVLSIAVAAAEVTALMTGAAAASWAGPVGWIAAGLMLLGALIMAYCSKNDLELYAVHCFIGNEYGQGDWDDLTGKAWMGGLKWPELAWTRPGHRSPERWARQRLALLRMLSGFRLFFGAVMNNCSAYINVGFLTPTSVFEVEVELYRGENDASPAQTRRSRIMPLAEAPAGGTGRVSFSRDNLEVVVHYRESRVTSVYVRAEPPTSGSWWHRLKARLDLDGSQQHYLPASGAWVTVGNYGWGWGTTWQESNSADVD